MCVENINCIFSPYKSKTETRQVKTAPLPNLLKLVAYDAKANDSIANYSKANHYNAVGMLFLSGSFQFLQELVLRHLRENGLLLGI